MKFDLTDFLELDTISLLAVNGGASCSGGSSGGSNGGSGNENPSGQAPAWKYVENSNLGVANANVGDRIIRSDGSEVVLTQGDIEWAKAQLEKNATNSESTKTDTELNEIIGVGSCGGACGGGSNGTQLNGSVDRFLENINSLVGGNYVYGGNDPTLDGGVDCSGSVLWAINQEDNNVADQTAQGLYENTDLIEYIDASDVRPGDLRFLLDETGTAYHVQVIVDGTGARFNATGGPENTINNPGTLEILNTQLPATGVYGRLNFEN